MWCVCEDVCVREDEGSSRCVVCVFVCVVVCMYFLYNYLHRNYCARPSLMWDGF